MYNYHGEVRKPKFFFQAWIIRNCEENFLQQIFWYAPEYDATDMSLDFLMLENSLASFVFGDTKPDSILFVSSSNSRSKRSKCSLSLTTRNCN